MQEQLYRPNDVPPQFRGLFEQLAASFPECEIWVRSENYGRWLAAGAVNRCTSTAATITLVRGKWSRASQLQESEVFAIRQCVSSADAQDIHL
jgi:hypothetical protein